VIFPKNFDDIVANDGHMVRIILPTLDHTRYNFLITHGCLRGRGKGGGRANKSSDNDRLHFGCGEDLTERVRGARGIVRFGNIAVLM